MIGHSLIQLRLCEKAKNRRITLQTTLHRKCIYENARKAALRGRPKTSSLQGAEVSCSSSHALLTVLLIFHRRHRHRKAQYAQSLEKEKIQLERFIREMDLESRRLSRQNNAILELLKAERVNADIDPLSAASPPESLDGGDVLISCDDVSIGSIGKFGLVTKGKGIAPDSTKSRSELRRGSHAAEVSQVARCRAILFAGCETIRVCSSFYVSADTSTKPPLQVRRRIGRQNLGGIC